jgi:CDP-diacylglycerol--serine O-phosphatidyltransferase
MVKVLSYADLITLINAIFGFLAIIMIFLEEYRISFSLILLALLADGLDGIVARKTGKGKIGDYLESMADMTSMSIAPMAFVFSTYHQEMSNVYLYTIFLTSLIIFLICSILRLSSFHIMKNHDYFVGLPASASTIYIVLLANFEIKIIYLMLIILITSILMISNIRFTKLDVRTSIIACLLILSTIILYTDFLSIAPLLLLLLLTVYVIVGPIYIKQTKKIKTIQVRKK